MTESNNLTKEIITWCRSFLLSHGYTIENKLPEIVRSTPWSHVARFVTSDGYIYLKHTPKLLSLEAGIIQILQDQFHAAVPVVIAHNPQLNCFLMKDAGRPLREILKAHFNASLYCKGIEEFTSLQLAVAEHITIFLDMGVPDWRLNKFPDLYIQLLAEEGLLKTDGLSEIEINELKALLPNVADLCEKLSDYSIQSTIVQPDFHDNNLLINETSQKITLIDLGEIVISHPFFSLVNCLDQAKRHYALTDKDDVYLQLMDACFKNYITSESKENLINTFEIAQILWFVYEALAYYRLIVACNKEEFMSVQKPGKLRDLLKKFMSICS